MGNGVLLVNGDTVHPVSVEETLLSSRGPTIAPRGESRRVAARVESAPFPQERDHDGNRHEVKDKREREGRKVVLAHPGSRGRYVAELPPVEGEPVHHSTDRIVGQFGVVSLEPPPRQLTHLGDSCRVVEWWIRVVDRIHYRLSARAKLGGRISDRFAKTFIGRSRIQQSGHTNDCDHGLTATLIDHGDMIAHHTLDTHASDPSRVARNIRSRCRRWQDRFRPAEQAAVSLVGCLTNGAVSADDLVKAPRRGAGGASLLTRNRHHLGDVRGGGGARCHRLGHRVGQVASC